MPTLMVFSKSSVVDDDCEHRKNVTRTATGCRFPLMWCAQECCYMFIALTVLIALLSVACTVWLPNAGKAQCLSCCV